MIYSTMSFQSVIVTVFVISFLGFMPIQTLKAKTVTEKLDLKGTTLILSPNEDLLIKGRGRICNGAILGNNSRIVVQSKRNWVMNSIELKGAWKGKIEDKVFKYNVFKKQDFQLVSNMFRFDTLYFSNRTYYLERWATIRMNKGDVLVDGNGVTFVLPCEKGVTNATDWGDMYKIYNLFSSSWQDNTYLTVKNINICDNREQIKGWGEDVTVEKPIIYFYFSPGQTNLYFENVNSDGCGALIHTYVTNHNSGEQIFKKCNIKTSQFAIELGNRQRAHTNKVVIEGCSIRRYRNGIFVGPVSIVGNVNQVDTVIIKNNLFYEPNVGNLELKGAKYVLFSGNKTTNMFCFTGSIQPPEKYECDGNHVTLCSGEIGKLMASMRIAGEEIVIKNNCFEITEKPFPFIEIYNPEAVKTMQVSGNTIVYNPRENIEGFQCLFSFSTPNGEFEFYDNTFETTYYCPHFTNYFPQKMKRFEDAFNNKVDNHR